MLKKRERLLNLMDERLAGDVLKLNDVIPRIWTETEIVRQT